MPAGLCILAASATALAMADAPACVCYRMVPGGWTAAPPAGWAQSATASLGFARYEGMPNGTMTLNEGIAVAGTVQFSDGTIDFDMKPLAYSDTGIIIRRAGNDGGEFVYLRAYPDCPAADDCIQYAPITHGRMQWDIFPDQQGPAPITPNGWNHIRLQVAGQRMRVYVNRAAEPSLVVARLQGSTAAGGIALKGPAVFANLVVGAIDPGALRDVRAQRPATGTVTAWDVAQPTPLPPDRQVTAADIPAGGWRPVVAEATGLVDLSRLFDPGRPSLLGVGWLRTVLTEPHSTRRVLRIGWARQVWVFVDGRQVFAGDNPYYPEKSRISPDGRLDADNARITVDLRQGANTVVLAVGDAWRTGAGVDKPSPYGWGAEMHVAAAPDRNDADGR